MQPLSAFILLALAAAASAESGGNIQLECPGPEWSIYLDRYEASCLKLMPEPKLFEDAFKACFEKQSRLLSFQHKKHKIIFVNNLIIKSGAENNSLWFFDPLDTHHDILKKEDQQHPPQPPITTEPEEQWRVLSPNADKSKIQVLVNRTAVPRHFICEAPARPAAQRAQLEREPEDAFISEEMFKEAAGKEPAKRLPFVLTFSCQAFGIPKPTVSWVMTTDTDISKPLAIESINATKIYDQRSLPVSESETGVLFFNLQRDCKAQACPNDNIQERSQLIVLNPHRMDIKKRIACVASNDFGSVLSREAQIYVTKLSDFANQTAEVVSVKEGLTTIVKNTITAEPDAAAVECFRVVAAGPGPAKLIPLEQVNQITHGGIQLSKATFDLIVDAVTPEDAGQFMCHARLHNGRFGHVTRERTFTLDVKPCPHTEAACNLTAKPVSVMPGYPTALSMNHLSNKIIHDGDDFLLECPCTGKRHPAEELTVAWNLNNRTDMQNVEAISILPKGSALLIRRANSLVHNGNYHCRCVRGREESDWSSVKVTVLPAPVAIGHPDLVHVKAGQTAILDCLLPVPNPAVTVTVQPLRGVKPLAEAVPAADSKRFQATKTGPSKFTLTISGVKETDSDVYGCRVIANYMGKWIEYDTYYTTLLVDKAH